MILSHVCRIMLKVSVSRRRNESMTLCASAPERNNPPLVIWISSGPCFQQLKKHCYCVAISMVYKVDIETRYGRIMHFSYNFVRVQTRIPVQNHKSMTNHKKR